MPAVKKGVPPPGERRVLIAELPDWAQLAFEGYECVPFAHDCIERVSSVPSPRNGACRATVTPATRQVLRHALAAGHPRVGCAVPDSVLLCRALNRIQSTIYDKAFSSNENILVCAPTGAGKTNIAMLTVLHEIASNMSDGIIQVSRPVLVLLVACC